jgi:hypothetical protein
LRKEGKVGCCSATLCKKRRDVCDLKQLQWVDFVILRVPNLCTLRAKHSADVNKRLIVIAKYTHGIFLFRLFNNQTVFISLFSFLNTLYIYIYIYIYNLDLFSEAFQFFVTEFIVLLIFLSSYSFIGW